MDTNRNQDMAENFPLIQDSIYNNIKIANPHATKHDIILAAEKAKVLDFAWEFPKGSTHGLMIADILYPAYNNNKSNWPVNI